MRSRRPTHYPLLRRFRQGVYALKTTNPLSSTTTFQTGGLCTQHDQNPLSITTTVQTVHRQGVYALKTTNRVSSTMRFRQGVYALKTTSPLSGTTTVQTGGLCSQDDQPIIHYYDGSDSTQTHLRRPNHYPLLRRFRQGVYALSTTKNLLSSTTTVQTGGLCTQHDQKPIIHYYDGLDMGLHNAWYAELQMATE